MPVTNVTNWGSIANKPTTVAGLGVSDFNATAIAAQAGAAVGAVGSYAFMGSSTTSTGTVAGGTKAGSALRYAGLRGVSGFGTNDVSVPSASFAGNGGTPSGTWRAMGRDASNSSEIVAGATLWLRIS